VNGEPFRIDRAWWRKAGSTSIGIWAATAVGFIATILGARAFGPSVYGAALLALAVAALVAAFLDVTLEQGVVHHGFRTLADGDIAGLRALIRHALTIDLAVGALVTALLVVFAAPIAELAGGGALDSTIIQLAALNVLASTLDPSTAAILQVAERQDLRAWAMVAANVCRLGAILVAIELDAGANGLVVAFAAGTAVGGGVQTWIAMRIARSHWPVPARRGELRCFRSRSIRVSRPACSRRATR
jgi:O-antigen/teichoic acid export membrane protein